MLKVSDAIYRDRGQSDINGKRHFHSGEYEMLHVISGNGVITIKDKLYPIVPNTVYLISGNDAHFSLPDIPASYVRNKIVFSNQALLQATDILGCRSSISDLFGNGGSVIKLSEEYSKMLDSFFFKLIESLKTEGEKAALRAYVNLLTIFETILQYKELHVPCMNNNLSDVLVYINENISEHLTLDIIAKENGISKYYLCHSFSSAVGMTVFEYIRVTRISNAMKLLTQTSATISEIALESGFESFAYFSKVFREQIGLTPREYRCKYRVSETEFK